MSADTINALCWVMIAVIWAFVLIGGWRTIGELRTVLHERREASRDCSNSAAQLAGARPGRPYGTVWG